MEKIMSNEIAIAFETETMKSIEKAVILSRLNAKSWNRTHTAKSLNVGIRTLQRKMKKYNLLELEPAELKLKNQASISTTEESASV